MGRSRELAELATAYDTGGSFGMRNRIINGDMRIDQRNAGASVTVGSGAPYVVDRWNAYNDLLNTTGQRSTVAPAGFTNSLAITVGTGATPTAGQIARIEQRIEGFNFADLGWGTASAQAATLSFWVRSSVVGTYSGAISNAPANRSYPFTFTISAANTYEYKTVIIPGDTTGTWETGNGTGCIVKFNFGSGSSWLYAAGSWASVNSFGAIGSVNLNATSGATFYITGVQLEKGSTATSFDFRDYGRELIMCQRYYPYLPAYKSIGYGTGAGSGYFASQFVVQPRVAPTGIEGSSIGSFSCYGGPGAVSITGLFFNAASLSGSTVRFSGSFTAGQAYTVSGGNIGFTGVEL